MASSTVHPMTFRSERRRASRLELDVHADFRRSRRRRSGGCNHAQVARAGAHALAADVELRRAIVQPGDDGFQSQRPEDDAITDAHIGDF